MINIAKLVEVATAEKALAEAKAGFNPAELRVLAAAAVDASHDLKRKGLKLGNETHNLLDRNGMKFQDYIDNNKNAMLETYSPSSHYNRNNIHEGLKNLGYKHSKMPEADKYEHHLGHTLIHHKEGDIHHYTKVLAALNNVEKAKVYNEDRYAWHTYNHPRKYMVIKAGGTGRTANLKEGDRFGIRPASSKKGVMRMITEEHGPNHVFSMSPEETQRLVGRSIPD